MMTISTSLLFSRAVDLMSKQQTNLAEMQEKVATGKELVRPSDSPDLAVNIARIKATIGEIDAFRNSLNNVNDRLTIEESYLGSSKDVLIQLKQLALQGANGTMTERDRDVIALEVDELIAEMKNLANGTDANGNFLFAGSRVATMPYQEDDDGIIRYQGDNFRPQLDYTQKRRSEIGRNGLDVFKPILTGDQVSPIPARYSVNISPTFEVGDKFQIEIEGRQFFYEVKPGDELENIVQRLNHEINESVRVDELSTLQSEIIGDKLQISSLDGAKRSIIVNSSNTMIESIDDLLITANGDPSDTVTFGLSGTMQRGDIIEVQVGSRQFSYVIEGTEGANGDGITSSPESVAEALVDAIENSGLFSQSVEVSVDATNPASIRLIPIRDNIGVVEMNVIERSSINDQSIAVTLINEPREALPEKMEFFESLQNLSRLLRTGSQNDIQRTFSHLDQMLDIVTLSLADIGAEMRSIEDELAINDDLKLQLESALSSEEDLDYATAITKMQAQMMSLEAAQASFAKISQLSVFDYIR